jgi:ABC-2 type transport system ATP-binding protein
MIKIDNLVKAFGPKRAVDGISFTVERGEVLGFLGPNGAGKSTTMRMITGFMPPTSGAISVGGYDVLESPIEAKRLIGYLPENAASYPDMTVHGFLNFVAELRGLAGRARKKAVNRVVELCFLDAVLYQSIDTLSKGYKHRTCLAQALIHDPQVLIMDEPTDGLDPNQKHEVRKLIKELGANKAIVFSTHILEEVDAACTRAIIIDRGRIVANGTPEELRGMSELAGAVTLQARGASAERLVELGRVEKINGAFRIYPRDKAQAAQLAQEVVDLVNLHGWKVEGMYSERGELDEVFRRITLPDEHRLDHREARAGGVLQQPGGVCVPGHLSAADRVLHLHRRQLLRARRSEPRRLLRLASMALPRARARGRDARVGRGAALGDDGAPADDARHHLAGDHRQVPGVVDFPRRGAGAHLPRGADGERAR